MKKLPASHLIEADEDFVKDLYGKLELLRKEEDKGYQKYSTYEAAKYCNKKAQTIRSHIRNFLRGEKDFKLLKAHKEEGSKSYIILKKDLDHYLKNPYTTI